MRPATDSVHVERVLMADGRAAMGLVILKRPEEMNPIDLETAVALGQAFEELAADADVRVVAVTGAGRAFSAGGDMKKYQELQRDSTGFPHFLEVFQRVFTRIAQHPKPFLALVNGIAIAGGLELILFCDLAFAAESARIGDAHLPYGQMGGGGSLTMLPRLVGPARARELILSGRLLSAAEALDWGIVSRVVPDDQLIDAGRAFTEEVSKKSALAVTNAKRVLNAALWDGTGVGAGLRLEREVTARYCLTSHDAPEGLAAFAEKRTPRYLGR